MNLKKILQKSIKTTISGTKVKIPLWFILLVIMMFVPIGLIRNSILRDKWLTLTNDKYGFSIDYLATWSAKKFGANGSRGVDTARAQFIGSGTIVYIHQHSTENPDLNDAMEWGYVIISNRHPLKELSPLEEIQIGVENYPALHQTYMDNYVFLSSVYEAYFLVHGDNIFVIEFSGSRSQIDKSRGNIIRMLQSFQFIHVEERMSYKRSILVDF